MNARHGALIFHLQSRPRTHLFLVTEKHCHAPCPCSAALPGEGTITRDNRADCGQEQWGKERSGAAGKGCQAGGCGKKPGSWQIPVTTGGCSGHRVPLAWSTLCGRNMNARSTAWTRSMSEEGQCLSKLYPGAGHRAAPPGLGMDTGTGHREGKADHGHGKQRRGAGTEKGTKVQGKKRTWRVTAEDYLLHLIEIPMQVPF